MDMQSHGMMNGMKGEMPPMMEGIPLWMAVTGVVFIILLTHLLIIARNRETQAGDYPKFNLFRLKNFRGDESILAIVLLALTSFHGFTMTPLWERLNGLLRVETGFDPGPVFTVLMILMILAPVLLFWFGAGFARFLSGSASLSTAQIFKAFSYGVLVADRVARVIISSRPKPAFARSVAMVNPQIPVPCFRNPFPRTLPIKTRGWFSRSSSPFF